MSIAMDAPDGLLRHVLVKSFVSTSPGDSNGIDANHIEEIISPSNMSYHTPSVNQWASGSTPPVFTPSASTPQNYLSLPTIWRTSKSSTSSSSPKRRSKSPILSLAQINEKEVLKTPSQPETPELAFDLNIPDTLIASATPLTKDNSSETNQKKGLLLPAQHQSVSDSDQSILRLPCKSTSPRLRSLGLERSSGSGSPGIYSKLRRSDISFGKLIGKGGFGSVYAASIAGIPVAVKIVQKRRGSGIHREILQAERLAFGLNLRQENIVAIHGVNMCEELRGDALIVMELVTSHSLQFLLDDLTHAIDAKQRLSYALQVAHALRYLHTHNVAHLDVKPSNVLMTPDHVCKLSDFGSLTQTGPNCRKEESEFTQLLGTLPYRAPELMTGLFPSTKADIYSYGITLWQMLTRESPHKGANPHALIYQVVKFDIRPIAPDTGNDVTEIMYKELFTSCWTRDTEKRPDACEIIPNIQIIVNSLS